ncbi:hypothetical protein MCUN1_001401 [Malassezia cuniculi]|uniref:Sulfate transporter family protein n=1 Tax=Malassezia cuniculi TaxID=948313 RepID=A0AAF0J5Z4_9BASI|nr:hypothetical protein MCUN1_001401 [Malassezia cuniculi]
MALVVVRADRLVLQHAGGSQLSVLSDPHQRFPLSQSASVSHDRIRDSTAELADMAFSPEDNSGVNRRHIYSDYDDVQGLPEVTEEAPLLPSHQFSYGTQGHPINESTIAEQGQRAVEEVDTRWAAVQRHVKSLASAAQRHADWDAFVESARNLTREDVKEMVLEPVRLIPPVILGMLLNVLDGVSYGMIMFPTSHAIFANFGGDGVSMFFASCVISQLVYTLGGSIFRGGNGSMMIEVVPFYHILVQVIMQTVGEDDPKTVVATTMAAFALSSILTGLTFYLLGKFRLGIIVSFFPRHILVGCIGGVGVFLIETGLAVCGRVEGNFEYNMDTLRYLTQDAVMITQWALPFALAVLLRVITHKVHSPIVFPAYFIVLPIVFYVIALASGHGVGYLREHGWVFNINVESAQFWRFYTYFDLSHTSFRALIATIPTQCALVFFGILHVPLNVPALGVSVGEDNVDTNRELVAHGYSNLLAGMLGTVPNYLCYVNSVLFYKVGGGSRLSGIMLAFGTALILIAGPSGIAYLPILVVGALIFVLGYDLVKEAVWDTFGRVNHWEYLTIWVIIIVMTISDFVVGVLVGIVLACIVFVMQTSKRNAVRAMFDGRVAHSTVRRHAMQRRFLVEVGRQTLIIKLQGFLFFGTINSVESLIRKILDIATWENNPIRFLILDCSVVTGMDFSAAETLTRIQRLLSAKDVLLVLAGITAESDAGVALRNVDLWMDRGLSLEVFCSLNEALEWTENEYLRGMYSSGLTAGRVLRKATLSTSTGLRIPRQPRQPALDMAQGFANSPRYSQIHEAAKNVTEHLRRDSSADSHSSHHDTQPFALIAATLGPYASENSNDVYELLVPHLELVVLPQGASLWEVGDSPEALYFIESGILRANYVFEQEDFEFTEAMLAGTIAGELSFLSQQKRNTAVVAELDTRLWRLDEPSLKEMASEDPARFCQLLQLLLRVTSDEQSVLMSYLVSRLS